MSFIPSTISNAYTLTWIYLPLHGYIQGISRFRQWVTSLAQAISRFRQSVTSLALSTPRFSLVPVDVGFVLDKVAQAQASFSEYWSFPLSVSSHSCVHVPPIPGVHKSWVPGRHGSKRWYSVCPEQGTCCMSPFSCLEFWDGSFIFGKSMHHRLIRYNLGY